ncbi:MAG: hypothetical protein M1831_003930 [Alyxoria varia]|nr:MAG: hypothetical protein M1831_003930 [Alyxoria varia]
MAESTLQKFVHNKNNSRSNSHPNENASNRRQPVNASKANSLRLPFGEDCSFDESISLNGADPHQNGNGHLNVVPDDNRYGTDYAESNDSMSDVRAHNQHGENLRRESNSVPRAAQQHTENNSNLGRGINTEGGQLFSQFSHLGAINAQMHSNVATHNGPSNGEVFNDADSYPPTSDGRVSELATNTLQRQAPEPVNTHQEQRELYSDPQQNLAVANQKRKKSQETHRRQSTETESSYGEAHRQYLIQQHQARQAEQIRVKQPSEQVPRPDEHAVSGRKQPKSKGAKPSKGHNKRTRTPALDQDAGDLQKPGNLPPQNQPRGQYQNGAAPVGDHTSPTPRARRPQPPPPAYQQPQEVQNDKNDKGLIEPLPVDYSSDVLMRKHFTELKKESFDKDPGAPQSTLPEDKQSAPLAERLDYCLGTAESQQEKFFASLPQAEWEGCAPWFMEQFQELNEKIVGRRREKREIAQRFEEDVAKRYDAVEGEITALSGALDDMKKNGGVLLNSGTPKRKR